MKGQEQITKWGGAKYQKNGDNNLDFHNEK